MSSVITRFPPSPTGHLHIGGVRTALFNYLFAKHHKGVMYLRFEDTDRERSKKEYEQDILDALHWMGIPYDMLATPRQSERLPLYKAALTMLIEKGHAYEAEEAENNPGKKVVRFKNPNTVITFSDLVRGEVTFDTTDLGDFVIARTIDEPLYHLAVVVDDHDMHISHVIRGEEHISNTPRQILTLEALGFARPQYAHIPLILAPDKSKLSKRHGAVSANEYRVQGFIPEAVINYLALLGWNPGGDRELYTLEELVEIFSLERVHKSGAVFDIKKLKWFNHEYLKKLSDAAFLEHLHAFTEGQTLPSYTPQIIPLLKERVETLKEAADAVASDEFSFMADTIETPSLTLLLQGAKADAAAVKEHLQKVADILTSMLPTECTAEKAKEALFPYATEVGRSAVLWPLRVALSGKEKSPDPFTLLGLLGQDRALARIAAAGTVL